VVDIALQSLIALASALVTCRCVPIPQEPLWAMVTTVQSWSQSSVACAGWLTVANATNISVENSRISIINAAVSQCGQHHWRTTAIRTMQVVALLVLGICQGARDEPNAAEQRSALQVLLRRARQSFPEGLGIPGSVGWRRKAREDGQGNQR
jgi:hypothetical protein